MMANAIRPTAPIAVPAASAPAAIRATDNAGLSNALLFLIFVLLNQGWGCGKDSWECQEQSADLRSVMPGDHTRQDGNCSAKEKSHKGTRAVVFVAGRRC
jgi:hypothetical protein